jgi:hypothetical protein
MLLITEQSCLMCQRSVFLSWVLIAKPNQKSGGWLLEMPRSKTTFEWRGFGCCNLCEGGLQAPPTVINMKTMQEASNQMDTGAGQRMEAVVASYEDPGDDKEALATYTGWYRITDRTPAKHAAAN